jgi:hypothetical protein
MLQSCSVHRVFLSTTKHAVNIVRLHALQGGGMLVQVCNSHGYSFVFNTASLFSTPLSTGLLPVAWRDALSVWSHCLYTHVLLCCCCRVRC